MVRLGPFESNPGLAVAVSGGADSMALALLAQRWAIGQHGSVHALVVDHGLRTASATEAGLTMDRMAAAGIPATLLTLTGLRRGPAMAERARIARYQALFAACRSGGWLHLLLGHHVLDQVETVMMRVLGHSMTHGLAAMPAVSETAWVRLLRPLLAVHPADLRTFLRARGAVWVEDPSNRDLLALRPRLRNRLAVHGDDGAVSCLIDAVRSVGATRARDEAAVAVELANRATIRPEGYAVLSPGRISTGALSSLIRAISGAPYAPGQGQVSDLAAEPRAATVAGVRIMPAGRTGEGFLVVREEAAMAKPVEAALNTVWDGRFRLIAGSSLPPGAMIGALGSDAARFRKWSPLPSAVLRGLPALWHGKVLAAVPHLEYAISKTYSGCVMGFDPRLPVAGSHFRPI